MENSKIEWTDHTFNPWIGCTKVSDGCKNCYAETLMDKRFGKVKWGPQGKRVRTSTANWRKPLKWNREAAAAGKRARVFCASLADVFEDKPDQPEMDEWRFDLFYLILNTPNLDWLLLTKRPENIIDTVARIMDANSMVRFFDSVWIGTSVENQAQADKRIPELLMIPARVRFLSMEPLLGAVDLTDYLTPPEAAAMGYKLNASIDWVIVGGESGPNARPMHPDWAWSIRDQCQAADVPFFFKQWGEWAVINKDRPVYYEGELVTFADTRVYSKFGVLAPDGAWYPGHTGWNGRPIDPDTREAYMVKVGRHAAGRRLAFHEWNQFPLMERLPAD